MQGILNILAHSWVGTAVAEKATQDAMQEGKVQRENTELLEKYAEAHATGRPYLMADSLLRGLMDAS